MKYKRGLKKKIFLFLYDVRGWPKRLYVFLQGASCYPFIGSLERGDCIVCSTLKALLLNVQSIDL